MAQPSFKPSVNVLKYGPWLQNAQISGITPLAPLFPKSKIDPTELDVRQRIEEFQREKFEGFMARELADMDVITDRKLKSPTLDNPIMPIYRQERRELQPSQP
ncbi:hypothetical protein SBOR_8642 [Sclerotinia borealis F-4128]|uniref:Uncharacterized protein n=1 Tax=Sclerotinia borealis (strain F-4128) TaxID=1432307 RepID=W9C7X6_SCLBF|nr:hypothetical protein SBOR_8642 [Sclerotinia borealis F-4128]